MHPPPAEIPALHGPARAAPWLAAVQAQWPALMAGVFAAAWLLAAWQPLYLQDWALENVLSLLAAWWLLHRHRRAPLSNLAYGLLCLFGIAHEIGSHFTYAEVPFRPLLRSLGFAGGGRNDYDRVVHFLFGLLCYRPLAEVLAPRLNGASARRYGALGLVAIISLLYEQLEMLAALVFGGDLGQAYLGTQGDVWDSQKDSALAFAGALLTAALLPRAFCTRIAASPSPPV